MSIFRRKPKIVLYEHRSMALPAGSELRHQQDILASAKLTLGPEPDYRGYLAIQAAINAQYQSLAKHSPFCGAPPQNVNGGWLQRDAPNLPKWRCTRCGKVFDGDAAWVDARHQCADFTIGKAVRVEE